MEVTHTAYDCQRLDTISTCANMNTGAPDVYSDGNWPNHNAGQ